MSNTHYYAGEQQDPTGLYYDRARYYNPTTGRFIGEDSVGGNGAMPASMNRYTYAQNAPATYTDPTGHDVWSNIDKMVSNYLQGVGVNTLHGLANVATQLGGGGLLALNGFNSNRAAAQLGQWAQNNPILAWAVVNANSLGYGAAVDTVSSYTNLIPVFGQAKMLTEGIAGQDLFSGRQLGSFERASNVLAGGFGLFTAGWGGAFGEAGSLAEGAGSTCSFDQNTPVATDKGETPIGQLQVGDKVLAYDQQSSTTGYYTVTAVLVNQDPTIEHLRIDDDTLTTTPEHPFFTEEAGWVAAGELKAGQHVRKADGSWGEVQQAQVVEQARTMYNLTVEKAHTFFVGDKQWLVHNTCELHGVDHYATLRANMEQAGVKNPAIYQEGEVGGWQAHHVIPHEFWDHPVIVRARRAGWNHDEWYNGIYLPSRDHLGQRWELPVHRGSHGSYSEFVGEHLDTLEQNALNLDRLYTGFTKSIDQDAFTQLRTLSNDLRIQLAYDSGSNGGFRLK